MNHIKAQYCKTIYKLLITSFIIFYANVQCLSEQYNEKSLCEEQDKPNWKPNNMECLICKVGPATNRMDIKFINNDKYKDLKFMKYDLQNLPSDPKIKMVGVEIEFFQIGGQLKKCKIATGNAVEEVNFLKIDLIDQKQSDYSSLDCPSPYNAVKQLIRAYFIIEASNFDMLTVIFYTENTQHVIGISKLRIYVSCMENCLTCSSQNKCEQCMPGFNLYEIDQNTVACEKVGQCQKKNCFTCATGHTDICIQCYPGFFQNINNGDCEPYEQNKDCIKEGKDYYDQSKGCRSYSDKCYFYSKPFQKYEPCSTNIKIQDYRCPQNSMVLIQNYYIQGQYNCGCQINNCQSCSDLNKCEECQIGYEVINNKCQKLKCQYQKQYYQESINQCEYCPAPADINYQCKDDNCCDSCQNTKDQGYKYSLSQQTCVQIQCSSEQIFDNNLRKCICKIDSCDVCYSDKKCDKCNIGYEQDATKTKCIKKNCSDGKWYSLDDEECILCSKYCEQCNKKECLTCKQFYSKDQNNKTQCQPNCGDNCQECNQDRKCLKCNQSYYLPVSNQINCKQCQNGCKNCTETQCSQCEDSYFLNDSKQCTQCNIENCKNCDKQNCINCISGYYLDESKKKCIKCEDNCIDCDKISCKQCISSYFPNLLNLKQCIKCHEKCNTCEINSSICLQCQEGYTQKDGDKQQCIKIECSQFCSLCSHTECKECNKNFFIDNSNNKQCKTCDNNCIECGITEKKCLTCKYGHSPNDDGQCLECGQNCESCEVNQSRNCISCKKKYFTNSYSRKNCMQCEEKCNKCNQETLDCIECEEGYKVDINNNKKCTKIICEETCELCNENRCLKCKNNKDKISYSNLKVCGSCDQSCLKCNDNTTECVQCQDSYYLLSNKLQCQKCSEKCKKCNQKECLDCIDDTYTKSIKDPKQCVKCYEQNKQCNKCSFDGTVCKECQSGTNLGHPGFCECHPTCGQCDIKNICKTCKNLEYQIDIENQSQCIQCQKSCSACTKTECLSCTNPNHYIDPKDKQRCKLCPKENCSKCNPLDPNECQQCKVGFTLNKDTNMCDVFKCRAQNCQTCGNINELQCLKCQKGYSVNNDYSCEQINSFNKNSYTITNTVSQQGYLINLEFKRKISFEENQLNLFQMNPAKYFSIQFSNTQNDQFQYKIESITDQNIKISIKPSINIKNQRLILQILDEEFLSKNYLISEQVSEELNTFVIISQDQLDTSKQVSSAGNTVSLVTVSSIVPVAIFGNFYLLTNTIDHTSFFYFLMDTDIRYPKNVLDFYGLFKNFQFPFIPNVFLYLIDPDYVQESPKVFMNSQNDAYFLKNSGQAITICIGVIVLFFIVRLLSFIPIKKLQPYLKNKFCNYWIMSAFLDLFFTEYLYLLFGCLLQFYCFEIKDQNSAILNYTLFTIITLILLISPFILLRIMYIQYDQDMPQHFIDRYQTILNGINIHQKNNCDTTSKTDINNDKNQHDFIKNENDINNQQNKENYSQNQQNDIQIQNNNINNNLFNPPHIKKSSKESNNIQSLQKIELIIVQSENSIQPDGNAGNQNFQRKESDNTSIFNRQKSNKKEDVGQNNNNNIECQKQSGRVRQSLFSNMQTANGQNEKESKQNIKSKISFKYSKYYFPVLYLRKLLFLIIVCFIYFDPYVQLSLISTLNIFMIWFLLYIQPFTEKFENYKNAAWEIILIGVQICSAFLVSDNDNQDEQERFNIGWIIIGLTSILIVVDTVILFVSLVKPIFSHAVKFIKKALKNQKQFIQKSNSLQKSLKTDQNKEQLKDQNRVNSIPQLLTLPSTQVYLGTLGNLQTEDNDLVQQQEQEIPRQQKRIKSVFIVQKFDDEQQSENMQNKYEETDQSEQNNEKFNKFKNLQSCYSIHDKLKESQKIPYNNIFSNEALDNVNDISHSNQRFGQNSMFLERKNIPHFRTNSLNDIKYKNQQRFTMHQLSFDEHENIEQPHQKIDQNNIFIANNDQGKKDSIFSNDIIILDD